MEIFDAITPREQETIKHYIQLYAGVAEPAPLPQVFCVWNKQKRTLYRLLGKKLRVRIPVEIPRNAIYFQRELASLYDTYSIWDDRDAEYFLNNMKHMQERIHNDFVFEYMKYILTQGYELWEIRILSKLIFHQNIENGYISTLQTSDAYRFNSFKSTVKNNMKTVRTIQKVLKAMRFPKMDLFEEWRNKVSDLNINKDIKANLVFSIHPLDFMSMSDNNCDWTSCMSWQDKGSYSAGTIEMMNSNMALIAYLESNTDFNIVFDEEEFSIPNKSWRCLFYINKYIMVGGRAYPYSNIDLIKVCMDKLRELAFTNLGWTYQYINQPYRDMQGLNNNYFVKYESLDFVAMPRKKKQQRHSIYLYTNGMYNDLIEYQDDYLCCRNYVKSSKKFCVSGPVTCMCCGDYITNPNDIMSYDDIGQTKVCTHCEEEFMCTACGEIKYNGIQYSFKRNVYQKINFCSKECLNDSVYYPKMGLLLSKDELAHQNLVFVGDKYKIFDYPQIKALHQLCLRNSLKKFFDEEFFKKYISKVAKNYGLEIYSVPDALRCALSVYYRADIYNIKKVIYISNRHATQNMTYNTVKKYMEEFNKWIPAKEILNADCGTIFV